jgi:diguanylate cyclase (GGDEF)-like protein
MWLHFILVVITISVMRLGMLSLIGFNVGVRVQSTVEIAALIILPFPLFCFAIVLSYIITVMSRIQTKHRSPFVGPDFHASIVIIAGLCASSVYSYLLNFFDYLPYSETIVILPTAIIFSIMKLFLQSILLSIEQNKPISEISIVNNKSFVTEAIMVATGAIIARIYQLDPALILVMLIPVILLKKSLMFEVKSAYIDNKTGLYNYRYFDETISLEYKKAKKTKAPLSLIFADMDLLREINNKYGHSNGDKALKVVATTIKNTIGLNNIATRFGGEEFVIIVPNMSKKQATLLAEEIRRKVANTEVEIDNGKVINVSISLGVASFPEDAKTIKQLISFADHAVYAAKNKGRNKVSNHTNIKE